MIKYKKIYKSAVTPKRGKYGDAGLDLFTLKDTIIKPNETLAISTGIAIELPYGMEAQVRPRSGLSINGLNGSCLDIIFSTIDCNYRGEIHIITRNLEDKDVFVPKGTRLAQMIVSNVIMEELVEYDKLEDSNRGNLKFGSSGIK